MRISEPITADGVDVTFQVTSPLIEPRTKSTPSSVHRLQVWESCYPQENWEIRAEEGEIDAEFKKKKKGSCSLRTIWLKFTTTLSYTETISPEVTMWSFTAVESQNKEVDPSAFSLSFWGCPLFHYNIYNRINSICI